MIILTIILAIKNRTQTVAKFRQLFSKLLGESSELQPKAILVPRQYEPPFRFHRDQN